VLDTATEAREPLFDALGAWSSLAMVLRRCGHAMQRREKPYADGKTRGSAIFCANPMAGCGYIASLTKRDP
jgi:hypothetical protein